MLLDSRMGTRLDVGARPGRSARIPTTGTLGRTDSQANEHDRLRRASRRVESRRLAQAARFTVDRLGRGLIILQVRNWPKFQSTWMLKKALPWHKFYRDVLLDPDIQGMRKDQRCVLYETWAHANARKNRIPGDDAWWRREFGRNGDVYRDLFLALGFLEKCTRAASSGNTGVTHAASVHPDLTVPKGLRATQVVLEVDKTRNTLAGAKKRAPRARKADPIWDELVEIFKSSPTAKTSAHGARNRAVRDLKAHGATPELVRLVARKYVERWGKDRLTDVALAKHYPALAGDVAAARANRAAACPECGIGGGQHLADCERAAA